MFSETFSWIGGSLVLAFIYIVVSNTLWLLFGARLVQSLPGVNITGFRGTMKISVMLILSVIGVLYWVAKYTFTLITGKNKKPLLREEISRAIQRGSKIITQK